MSQDTATADAFADSWNNLPNGSVYTRSQFEDWFAPITAPDVIDRTILELGCGNGSLLVHMAAWNPKWLVGIDLGSSVISAQRNMEASGFRDYEIQKGDLTAFSSNGFDLVYSIGVLHHLKEPVKGFQSVIANTKPGGRFHCWVYAHEGNAVVIHLVDPIRKIASKLPWWFTKYLIASPLVVPYYIYAKLLRYCRRLPFLKFAPLYQVQSVDRAAGLRIFSSRRLRSTRYPTDDVYRQTDRRIMAKPSVDREG